MRVQAVLALAALGRVERDHVVARLDRLHARPDLDHDARALVAEDRREQALGVGAGERVRVGVADAGRLDLDQHLAGLRPLELDGLDRERLPGLVRHRRAYVHLPASPRSPIANRPSGLAANQTDGR